ncbi:MAG: class I SAM-dependent methyltransferase [Fimbriimonas sp.]
MKPPVNPVGSWEEYFASTRGLPLHPLYRILEPHLPAEGKVLELGCGVGTGARWLAQRGLRVHAVDALPEAFDAADMPPGLTFECAYMQRLNLPPESYDVVVAGFCLFFLTREELAAFWPRLVASLRPGGLFMGQCLGERDDWARDYLAQSRAEVEALLAPFEVLHWEEAERDGKTSQGTAKHWHVHHVVARVAWPSWPWSGTRAGSP